MSKTILITGAGGQVGRELARSRSRHNLACLSQQQLDITKPEAIAAALTAHEPSLVINPAAYTQVDRAEHERQLAFAINRDGTANLAEACHTAGIPLFHISTDYVFDGIKASAYVETDPVAPLGVYGESKAEGEAELAARLTRHIILRSSWVFSASGSNFVKTMLRLGHEREVLEVVDDQHGCPTAAASIAGILIELAERYLRGEDVAWGTYHYCDKPATTWFGFAREIFIHAAGYESLKLNPITTADYPTPAMRPQNSVLDCGKLESVFALNPGAWHAGLDTVLAELRV